MSKGFRDLAQVIKEDVYFHQENYQPLIQDKEVSLYAHIFLPSQEVCCEATGMSG